MAGHQHSRSEGGFTFPQSGHPGSIDYTPLSNLDTGGHRFSHPTNILRGTTRGHQRGSSSGSRDRGTTRMGLHSAHGGTHVGPYPSPHNSQSPSFGPLPSIPKSQTITYPSGMGRDGPVFMPACEASTYRIPPGGIGELSQQLNSGGNLSDTETDAKIECPIRGCRGVFTKAIELQGALCRLLREMGLTRHYRPLDFT